jgi:glycine oxidase
MMKAGIVGMGVMGSSLALALHQAGWEVSLFDQGSGDNNCSLAAAGLLTPFSELDKAHPLIIDLGQESIQSCWPRMIESLSDPIYFERSGTMILSHPQDQAEWNLYSRRLLIQCEVGSLDYQSLVHDDLIALEPELSKFDTGYYFPQEAHIDSQSLIKSLKNHLQEQGVKFFFNTPISSIEARLIISPSSSYKFDWVFDCRGLGAQSVFSDLRPVRGELMALHAPDVHLNRPIRLLHPRYSLYIVPRPGDIYLVGASEIEAEDYSPISVRTTLELLTAAYYVHPGFIEARLINTVTHCRPTLSTHLPKIRYEDGLVSINGLYRHGYLIAPALAEEVLRGINTQCQRLDYPTIWEF